MLGRFKKQKEKIYFRIYPIPALIDEIFSMLDSTRSQNFTRMMCFCALMVIFAVAISMLWVNVPNARINFELFIMEMVVVALPCSLALLWVYWTDSDKIYYFYYTYLASIAISFIFGGIIDQEFMQVYFTLAALPFFLAGALINTFPKGIFISSAIYWISLASIRYLIFPHFDFDIPWLVINFISFVAFVNVLILLSLTHNLEESVQTQKEQIQTLYETDTALNISLNATRFGIIGFAQNGEKRLERGPSALRLFEGKEETTQILELDEFKIQIEKAIQAPFKTLFESFKEVHTQTSYFLIRAHQLENILLITHMDVTQSHEFEQALSKQQKLSLIGEITSGVAHNYNNALAVALAELESIPERNRDKIWLKHIRPAIHAIERSTEVSRKLLIMAGRQNLDLKSFDMSASLRSSQNFIQSAIGSNIKLTVDAPQPLMIHTDSAEFESSVLNLAINARNAIEQHKRNDRQYEITIRAKAFDDFAVVDVIDNGPGIAPENVKKVFDPFFTTRSTPFSTGLGLSTVKGFVEQSNGIVKLSTSPKGTTISLHFPKVLQYPVREKIAPKLGRVPFETAQINHTILLVDDNPKVITSFAKLIENFGFKTINETSPTRAVDLIDERPDITLAFLDFSMPEMDGICLAKLLQKKRPDLKIYILTGDVSSISPNSPAHQTEFEVLIKPLRASELIEILRKNYPALIAS